MKNNQALSVALTSAYRDKTLPDGWYYFSCAGTKAQIGKYVKPTKFEIGTALSQGLPPPQPALHACPGLFIGVLDSIRILSPVPPFDETEL